MLQFRKNSKSPQRNRRLTSAPSFSLFSVGSIDWGRVRLWGVGIFFSALWLSLWAQAYKLQVIQGPDLAQRASRQHMAREIVRGVRGNIMDRNGHIMARSIESHSIAINPRQVKDKAETAATLAGILGVPQAQIMAKLEAKNKFVWLIRKANDSVAKKVKEAGIPGITITPEFERVYPYKTLAGQLLGFVNVDDNGIEGIEKAYDDILGAQSLRQLVQRDAAGRRLSQQGDSTNDLRGRDIRLTIDTQVQFFAEEALAESVQKYDANWGGCIVVDVPTGEVLAWAQYPFFDPNLPNEYAEKIRRNRLATDALEQGSTIKSFLIAAALEEKVIEASTPIYCEKGVWKLRSAVIHDTRPYESLPVSKILHVSSNIGMAKIGLKLGANKYYSYLRRLGFGSPVNLPLAGQSRGILRAPNQWQEIDTAAASFGQSFSATLVQMAKAYLTLASDGVNRDLKLTIEDLTGEKTATETVAAKNDKIFSPQTMRQVRSMLREVVEEEGGTGKQARIPGLEVGGKTGTAQKADNSGRYGSGRVGSFVGMVPIDKPRYLICVLLDEPKKNQYGGVVAAPVFQHVALSTMAYHGYLPDTDDPIVKMVAEKEASRKAKQQGGAKTPNRSLLEQQRYMRAAGDTQQVAALSTPAPVAQPNAKQLAKEAAKSRTVPNVVGLGVKTAVEAFAIQGVMPAFQGAGGFVVRQVPPPGTPWPEDKQCVLWLEDSAT